MDDTDIAEALGRIENKVDNVQATVLGLEPRIRTLETDSAVIKTKAGIASAIVAAVVTSAFTIAGWLLKR